MPSGTYSQALIMKIILTFIMRFVTSAVATDCKAVEELAEDLGFINVVVALTIMEECFVPMVDTRTSIHMIPHVMYN
uniref:Secreted protein n=1 Tax=Tanacetum cinerariifolium TaxID=118510 RepID=A0A6L2NF07_TANCI|nr:hypothetical protein [Tanacetum cinerariifolium]